MSPDSPTPFRIADHNLADEVRAEDRRNHPRHRRADPPSSTSLFQILVASMPAPGEDEPSYFAHGIVEMLFTASASLFAITPWSLVDDNQDPAHGHPRARRRRRLPVDHRTARPEPGRADLFPRAKTSSISSRPPQTATPNSPAPTSAPSRSPSTTPRSCRRPCAARRCRTAGPSTTPTLTPSSLGETPAAYLGRSSSGDVETVAACALALSAFLPKHAAIFKAGTFTPVCESYFDDEDREVRFTVPLRGHRPLRLSMDPPIRKATP